MKFKFKADQSRPLTFVLLGATGSGKSTTANTLLQRPAFDVGNGARSCTPCCQHAESVEAETNTPIYMIDTPGFGDSGGNDDVNIRNMVSFLEEEVMFVNTFLLVLNGQLARFDQQTFCMLRAYVSVFGTDFFNHMMVVVTHWDMSPKATKQREKKNITQESFQQEWAEELCMKIEIPCDCLIEFVFIDNELSDSENFEAADEIEQSIFKKAKGLIVDKARIYPLFTCVRLNSTPEIREKIILEASEQGLNVCSKCGRCFISVQSDPLVKPLLSESEKAALSAQSVEVSARGFRVIEAVSKGWNPEAATKAMTRGWNANTGVHLFGKMAMASGIALQTGVAMYRVLTAKDDVERAKAVFGTGASIGAGFGGAWFGSAIGTFIFPGAGTILGGIVGGIASSIGAQRATEATVGAISDWMQSDLCQICSKDQT